MTDVNTIKLIAGPCSAESRNQVIQTANALKGVDLSYFRAGIWKPRTSPNSFEGIGVKGLEWLVQVKEEVGFKTMTEVATTEHVEACLEKGIDALWIGARTTVNPLYVQELANALSGVDIPIFIKNPISPDMGLWLGAIDRFKKAGLNKISAIHRGFFSYEKQLYRNPPMWEVPVKLKTTFPNMEIICDPSHIAGNASLIESVSQEALLYGMDGLMIETHPNPKEALSDAQQQVTPKQLKQILQNIKTDAGELTVVSSQLKQFRKEINRIDLKLLHTLVERMKVVEEIAWLKKENSATYFQADRWKSRLEEVKSISNQLNLRVELVEEIMHAIHKESLLKHHEIYKKKIR